MRSSKNFLKPRAIYLRKEIHGGIDRSTPAGDLNSTHHSDVMNKFEGVGAWQVIELNTYLIHNGGEYDRKMRFLSCEF